MNGSGVADSMRNPEKVDEALSYAWWCRDIYTSYGLTVIASRSQTLNAMKW